MDKPFKTFLEQVEILDTRMKTDEDTIYYLMRNNYYSIVNFLQKNRNTHQISCII